MTDAPKKVSAKAPYTIRVQGALNPTFVFERAGEVIGSMQRRRGGPLFFVQSSTYTPVKGEVISIDRDPGLLRHQFGAWSQIHGGQGREWLGSSIRYGMLGREISLHGGNKPFRLVPTKSFGTGWELHAPKTGLVATFSKRGRTIEVTLERRVDFYLLLLAFHNIASAWISSIWPGPDPTPPVI